MRNRSFWLVIIALLVALASWVDSSSRVTVLNPFTQRPWLDINTEIRRGLDTKGGLQALLEADVADCAAVDANSLDVTRQILENRANALGVSEITMQVAGQCRIVAEFPGATNKEEIIRALQQTALLEFVDLGSTQLVEGTAVVTDHESGAAASAVPTAQAGATSQPTATTPTIYHTVMTGAGLQSVAVVAGQVGGQYEVSFVLKSDAAKEFADYTTNNVGKYLAIVLDKKVVSAPVIRNPITDGQGVISGNFTNASANQLAVQLRYGSLPVPVKLVQSQDIGATLGQDSINKGLRAGIIGLAVVILFMALYYRLPGAVADLALVIYAATSLMLFKLIPVVITLPGLAGFILSVGMAVDANVLIFERLKEELRAGRSLQQAIDLAWSRAWPSIRDSNTSTLITSAILFIFGNTFGASIVKGFSVTLALGVIVSLFTAIIVTRSLLHLILDTVRASEHPRWFGL